MDNLVTSSMENDEWITRMMTEIMSGKEKNPSRQKLEL